MTKLPPVLQTKKHNRNGYNSAQCEAKRIFAALATLPIDTTAADKVQCAFKQQQLHSVQKQIALSNLPNRELLLQASANLCYEHYMIAVIAIYSVFARTHYCGHALRAYNTAVAAVNTEAKL